MNLQPSLRQRAAFSVLFLMGANLLIGCSYRAEQDSWISVLFACSVLVVWSLVFARISSLQPGKNVFQILQMFPKWLCYPLTAILTIYCFSQAALTVRVYAGFVTIVSLENTDLLILIALTCFLVWYFLKKEDRVLYQFSYVSAIPILLIVLLLFCCLFPLFRTDSLFPILFENTKDVLFCAAENIAFPFGNIFLLLGVICCSDHPKRERRTWVFVSLIAGLLSLLIVFQNLLLMGGKLSKTLEFPYNFSASLVNIGDFFSRIEVFTSLFFFASAMISVVYFMKMVNCGVCTLFSIQPKGLSLPLSALLCGYSAVVFDYLSSAFHYLQVFPWFALPLQFLLPIAIWIFSEVQAKQGRNSTKERDALSLDAV